MTERSRTEYSIVNIAASMGGYALNIILSFICRIVFAHQLSADYLGGEWLIWKYPVNVIIDRARNWNCNDLCIVQASCTER